MTKKLSFIKQLKKAKIELECNIEKKIKQTKSKFKLFTLKFSFWTIQKLNLLIGFILLAYSYVVLHEYIHYFVTRFFGYSAKISFGLILSRVQLENVTEIFLNHPKHLLLINLAPHIFNMIILIFLNIIIFVLPNKLGILSKIAFFPFTDTIFNLFVGIFTFITKSSNDFSNIIFFSKIFNISGIMLLLISIIFLTFSILMKPFYKELIRLIKFKN